jgi:hypothetical protein
MRGTRLLTKRPEMHGFPPAWQPESAAAHQLSVTRSQWHVTKFCFNTPCRIDGSKSATTLKSGVGKCPEHGLGSRASYVGCVGTK